MTDRASRRAFLSRSAQQAAVGAAALSAPSAEAAAAPGPPRLEATFSTDMKRPRKLAVCGNLVHVAGDCLVRTFRSDGTACGEHRLERPARCLAAAGGRQLLVGMLRTIVRLDRHGNELARWSAPEDAVLSSLAVTTTEVLAADARQGTVWRYDHEGALKGSIRRAAKFAAPAEFFHVAAVSGQVHVNNPGRHRIETFAATGEHLRQWGGHARQESGFSGCCNPVSFAVLANGDFVTAERGVPRVKRFDAEGKFLGLLCGPEDFADNARVSAGDQQLDCHAGGLDVAADGRNRIYVLDRVSGEVRVLRLA